MLERMVESRRPKAQTPPVRVRFSVDRSESGEETETKGRSKRKGEFVVKINSTIFWLAVFQVDANEMSIVPTEIYRKCLDFTANPDEDWFVRVPFLLHDMCPCHIIFLSWE